VYYYSSYSIATAPDPSFVIPLLNLRVGPSRSVASAHSSQSHYCLYTLEHVSSCAPHLSSRSIHNDMCPIIPLLARAGVLLCEPPETVGKGCVGWTGSTAWLNAGRILRLHQNLRGQPTNYHVSQHRSILDSSCPWSVSPCALHNPCQHTRRVAVPLHAFEYSRMWSHYTV